MRGRIARQSLIILACALIIGIVVLFATGFRSSAAPDWLATQRKMHWVNTVVEWSATFDFPPPVVENGKIRRDSIDKDRVGYSFYSRHDGPYLQDIWGHPLRIVGAEDGPIVAAAPRDIISPGRNGVYEHGRGDDISMNRGINTGHYWKAHHLAAAALATVSMVAFATAAVSSGPTRDPGPAKSWARARSRTRAWIMLGGAAAAGAALAFDGTRWTRWSHPSKAAQVISVSVFAAGCFAALSAAALLCADRPRWRRPRRKQPECVRCRYPLAADGTMPRCPECGLEHPPRTP